MEADKLSRDEQLAFWLNAYDAFILRTVIDGYPIARRSNAYPARSIRQIPGAFERIRAAGKSLTLDEDRADRPVRLSRPAGLFCDRAWEHRRGPPESEVYTAERLELAEGCEQCASGASRWNRGEGKVLISSIFSWREKDFVAAYAASARRARRSQPGRAGRPRLRRAETSGDGTRVPREESVSGVVQPVRLDAERLDRPRRPLTWIFNSPTKWRS